MTSRTDGQPRSRSVSVIVPCFNAARHLRETLESVAAQTVRPADMVVVDDGSSDHRHRSTPHGLHRIRVITKVRDLHVDLRLVDDAVSRVEAAVSHR